MCNLCVFCFTKVWSSKTLRCFDAMGVVGSQDVKNMRMNIISFKPCTHGVMLDDKQLSLASSSAYVFDVGWQQSLTFPLNMFDVY